MVSEKQKSHLEKYKSQPFLHTVYQDKFQMNPKCKIKKYQKQEEVNIIIAKGQKNPPNKIKDEYISAIKLIL